MKTDKFSDAVRRKLESMEPAYRERDWDRLQHYLRANGVLSAGTAAIHWLWPTAAAATVVSLLVTVGWQYRTNQELRETVRTLKQAQVAQAPTQPAETITDTPAPAVVRTDTVYITRYVQVPAPAQPQEEQLADRPTGSERLADAPIEEGVTSEPLAGEASETRATERTKTGTGRGGVRPGLRSGEGATRATGPDGKSGTGLAERYEFRQRPGSTRLNQPLEKPEGSSGGRSFGNRSGTANPGSGQYAGAGSSIGRSGSGAGTEAAGLQWLSLTQRGPEPDPAYFMARIDRRARRIRSLIPVKEASVQPVIQEEDPEVKFRLGIGVEAGSPQWSLGLNSEILAGSHLVLGIGLNRQVLNSGQFLTDIQFNQRTRRDFRRDYAAGLDPRHEIMDIRRRTQLVQVPITLGYRIRLQDKLTLTPTVGTNLVLQAREFITFTSRTGPVDFLRRELVFNRPATWYMATSTGLMLERQQKNWVIQGGPYVNFAWQKTPNGTTARGVGARVRVLYQF